MVLRWVSIGYSLPERDNILITQLNQHRGRHKHKRREQVMFIRFLFALIILATSFVVSLADETQALVTHCLDTSTEPVALPDIDFDGIIFLSSSDGTRALRNSLPTSYILAPADHYRSFGTIGTFSPDGKWYVYPTGTSFRINWTDRQYNFRLLNFVDTHTGLRVFSLPTDGSASFISRSYPLMPEYAIHNWLSPKQYILDENTVINVKTQIQETYEGAIPIQELTGGIISPDGTRMIVYKRIVDIASGETVLETDDFVRWLADGSGYYVRSREPDNLSIYDMDGNLRFSDDQRNATVSQTGKWVAWKETEGDYPVTTYRFFIKDTESGQTVDLCSDIRSIIFSPDDTQAAILIDLDDGWDHVWIVNLETWDITPIDLRFPRGNVLVGWWSS